MFVALPVTEGAIIRGLPWSFSGGSPRIYAGEGALQRSGETRIDFKLSFRGPPRAEESLIFFGLVPYAVRAERKSPAPAEPGTGTRNTSSSSDIVRERAAVVRSAYAAESRTMLRKARLSVRWKNETLTPLKNLKSGYKIYAQSTTRVPDQQNLPCCFGARKILAGHSRQRSTDIRNECCTTIIIG